MTDLTATATMTTGRGVRRHEERNQRMVITAKEMDAHVDARRARRWTEPLRGGELADAAQMDGTWYVVTDDSGDFSQAPPELAALLTDFQSRLAAADTKLDELRDARSGQPQAAP